MYEWSRIVLLVLPQTSRSIVTPGRTFIPHKGPSYCNKGSPAGTLCEYKNLKKQSHKNFIIMKNKQL